MLLGRLRRANTHSYVAPSYADLMLKYRAKYAAIIAGVSAPIYFLIQLIFGSDAGPSLVRTLWFFLVVFLACLAVKWEAKTPSPADQREETPPVRE